MPGRKGQAASVADKKTGTYSRPGNVPAQCQPRGDGERKVSALLRALGHDDFRWIDAKNIAVAQWVRMKCAYGCGNFGKKACCPPNGPTIDECRDFVSGYERAIVFHFPKKVEKPEDRHSWTPGVNRRLLEAERAVFLAGFHKAFLTFIDSCHMCNDCQPRKEDCNNKKQSRPAPEAIGIDVFATVRSVGYPIEVLTNYGQEMNRYAILFVY